jgi:ankyrin repeat protein
MMKKLRSVFLLTIYLLFAGTFLSAQEANNPANYNIDLSSFARNISLTADNDEGAYSCTINLKFKKNIPVRNDTLTFFLKFASNFSCEKLNYEFLIDDKVISSGVINNTITKAKSFDSSVVIQIKNDIGESTIIKLSFTGISEKKPWIQLKEAKLPKEPKVQKEQKTPKEPKEPKQKAEKKSKKETKTQTEEPEIIESTENSQPESQVSETSSETEFVSEAETSSESEKTVETSSQSETQTETPTVSEAETSAEKNKKGSFSAWLKSLFSKKNKKLPKEVQTYVETLETNQNSLFINSMNKKKKLSQLTGPFNTNEQVILVWIYKELPENTKYAVSNNDKYITDSPSVFFADSYKEVTEYITVHGMEEAFKKYFSANTEKKEEPVLKIENKEPEKTEILESVVEESKQEPEPEPVIEETPFFELPLNNDSNSNYSSYKKEYLQDYAPKKKLELPKESISEKTIDNPDESDSFGRTLLMKAAQNGNNWEIKSLLASGADINLKDNDGWTALMYAIRYQQNISIVETLINAGAKIKVKNKYDLSPLILAASYNGNPEITKKILSYYSVSEKEVLQAFVLMLSDNSSSDFAKLAKIEEFLYKSIPLNTFYNGKTPLMYAAQYSDSTKILNCLMEAGAITSIRSTEGKTAFDYAQENKLLEHDDCYWALNRK